MAKRPPTKSKTKAEVKAAADRAEARSRKNKPATEAKAPAEESRAYTSGRMISQNDLKNLLRRSTSDANQISTINGSLRERIAEAVEKKHLDKKAFALLRRLDKMENEDLANFWDNLEAYMDMAGLTERIESVGKLPLPEPAEKAEEPEKTETKDETPPAPETSGGVSRPRLAAVAGAQVD